MDHRRRTVFVTVGIRNKSSAHPQPQPGSLPNRRPSRNLTVVAQPPMLAELLQVISRVRNYGEEKTSNHHQGRIYDSFT